MKKVAQQSTFDVKRDELKGVIDDALTNLNTQMQRATQQLTQQMTTELNNIVTNLSKEVEVKINELKSITPQMPQQTQQGAETHEASYDLPGVVKESKKKGKPKHSIDKPMPHPTPRDTEHTKELPAFWRRNYDYGESPYMNLEKLEKITDKPPYKKKRKKKKGERLSNRDNCDDV